MCGIAGIVGGAHPEAVRAMADALVHRGPDGEGFYNDERASLGHRRLSIIDLDGGHQPISSPDGRLQLICNGEIYNSPELRRQWQGSGYQFKTQCDVEVILALYQRYGADCVKHLRGQFAFAVWDSAEETLFLARDHIGQKPLYYSLEGGVLLFGSEPKAILASGMLKPEMSLEGLWHYMSLRYMPDDYSMFKGIHKLPAAQTLTWRAGQVETNPYWRLDFNSKLPGGKAEAEGRLAELLLETVRDHQLSDVQVGAWLSGGIDSSTIASMMASTSAQPVPCFSIGFAEQQFNELPYARMVAQRYGMDAHERIVEADLVHLMPSMVNHMDEPSDPFGVGVYLSAQLASEHVKVVLSGDGGDENFAGYDRFAGQQLASYYGLLPETLRHQVMARVIRMIPESFGYKSLAQKATWLHEMSFHSDGQRYAQSLAFLRFMPAIKEELFTASARARIGDDDSVGKVLRYFDADNADHLVDRMLHTDLMTRMPDHLLAIVDRMSMAHGLEARAPLVDYRIVELAASLPPNLKLRGMNLKYILKQVAAHYLPRELIQRKKQGLSFPIAQWLRTSLRGFMLALLAESRLVEAGIFQRAAVDRLVTEHLSGRVDHNYRLWMLINLEIWYRLYLEGQTLDELRELTCRLSSAAHVSEPAATNC
jgi:asparagine synthase (glutamine-hydrolysing)